jgi:hypothetical protein
VTPVLSRQAREGQAYFPVATTKTGTCRIDKHHGCFVERKGHAIRMQWNPHVKIRDEQNDEIYRPVALSKAENYVFIHNIEFSK